MGAKLYKIFSFGLSIFAAMTKAFRNHLRTNKGLILTIFLALVIRVIHLLLYHSMPEWNQLTVDNYYHHHWALSIAEGNLLGDTTYFRAPFYVFCLALLYWIFGTSLWIGRVFGLFVGIFSVLMTYEIGRKVFGRKAALLAAVVHSLYPACIYFESELLLDPLFTLLLQLTIYKTLSWWEHRSIGSALCCGLLMGLAAITRPTALILAPIAVVLFAVQLKNTRSLIRHAGAFLLAASCIIAPILIRNVAVANDPVPIASQGGINFYIGNNDAADGVSAVLPEPLGFNWRISRISFLAEKDLGISLKPGEVSSYWTNKAVRWIRDHPGRFLRLYLTKLYHAFSNREISNNRNLGFFFQRIPTLKYNLLSFGILLLLAAAGVVLLARENKRVVLLTAIILSYVAVSSLFFFNSRFRLPLLPYYMVLASGALCTIVTRLPGSFREIRSAVLAMLVAIIVGIVGILSFYPLVPLGEGGAVQPYVSKGLYHLAEQEYQKALRSFHTARSIDPAFPEINLNIGTVFFRLGMADSALCYFDQEKLYNPGRTKAYTNSASIHLLNGRYRQALKEIREPLSTRPYDVVANMVFLRALFKDTAIGIAELADSVLLAAGRTGNNLYLLNDAAALLIERGETQSAEAILLRAVNSRPPPIETDDEAFERNFKNSRANWVKERSRSYYQLGYLSGLTGMYSKAIDYSKLAIEIDSNLVEAYINLISGYLSAGQHSNALETHRMARERFPSNDLVDQMGVMLGR